MSPVLGGVELNQLRWRCRRGLLENDLFIERYFRRVERGEETLTTSRAEGLMILMDLADNDLLDLLLARTEPAGPVDTPEAREVLAALRTKRDASQPSADPVT